MLIDEEFDFLIASLAFRVCFFALRAIASLALRARSQRAAGGGFAGAKLRLFFILALRYKARFWWETFVVTKVLPPSPLSKKLWVRGYVVLQFQKSVGCLTPFSAAL